MPDEYSRDGKEVFEEGSSSAGYRTKKSGAKNGRDDECRKVYECRFCSLKFCKSQALGGHMNRHRQERETETLNRARQLVFNNDNLTTPGHLGYVPSSYHPSDPTLSSFRSVRPPRFFSGSPPTLQPPQLYLHPSSQTPTLGMKDYYLGLGASDSNYSCIGAPAGNVFGHGPTQGSDLVGPGRVGGVGFRDVTRQHLDHPSTNRFEDGF
ncbi:JAGGED [Hibiscus trionum]|uniref:JAGGED n=1 Tax=Hibiscus trionum TaxID=183268 RepID=A0A9W7HCC1_HIBTR|nr:JAGGED [Hibiscus trionum]